MTSVLLYNSCGCQHAGMADDWYVSPVCRGESDWTETSGQEEKTVDEEQVGQLEP